MGTPDCMSQLKEWSDLGNDINMAINLSARQFKDNDFIETVYSN